MYITLNLPKEFEIGRGFETKEGRRFTRIVSKLDETVCFLWIDLENGKGRLRLPCTLVSGIKMPVHPEDFQLLPGDEVTFKFDLEKNGVRMVGDIRIRDSGAG